MATALRIERDYANELGAKPEIIFSSPGTMGIRRLSVKLITDFSLTGSPCNWIFASSTRLKKNRQILQQFCKVMDHEFALPDGSLTIDDIIHMIQRTALSHQAYKGKKKKLVPAIGITLSASDKVSRYITSKLALRQEILRLKRIIAENDFEATAFELAPLEQLWASTRFVNIAHIKTTMARLHRFIEVHIHTELSQKESIEGQEFISECLQMVQIYISKQFSKDETSVKDICDAYHLFNLVISLPHKNTNQRSLTYEERLLQCRREMIQGIQKMTNRFQIEFQDNHTYTYASYSEDHQHLQRLLGTPSLSLRLQRNYLEVSALIKDKIETIRSTTRQKILEANTIKACQRRSSLHQALEEARTLLLPGESLPDFIGDAMSQANLLNTCLLHQGEDENLLPSSAKRLVDRTLDYFAAVKGDLVHHIQLSNSRTSHFSTLETSILDIKQKTQWLKYQLEYFESWDTSATEQIKKAYEELIAGKEPLEQAQRELSLQLSQLHEKLSTEKSTILCQLEESFAVQVEEISSPCKTVAEFYQRYHLQKREGEKCVQTATTKEVMLAHLNPNAMKQWRLQVSKALNKMLSKHLLSKDGHIDSDFFSALFQIFPTIHKRTLKAMREDSCETLTQDLQLKKQLYQKKSHRCKDNIKLSRELLLAHIAFDQHVWILNTALDALHSIEGGIIERAIRYAQRRHEDKISEQSREINHTLSMIERLLRVHS